MQIRHALPLLAGACLMPALAVGQASPTNVQLYGQATAGVTAKSHQAGGDSSVELGNSVLASSFIGLRGTEDLGGGMSALFRLESAVNIGNGVGGVSVAKEQKFWNRHAFVGLNLSPGIAITAGRQYLPHADRVLQTLDVYNIGGTSLHTTPLGLFGVNRFVGNDNRTDSSLKLRWRGASGWTAAAGVGLNDGAGRSASVDVAHVAPSHAVGAYAAKYESPTVVAATGDRPEHRVVGLGGQMAFGPARVFLHVASAELDSTQAGGRVQKNLIVAPAVAWSATPALTLKAALTHDKGTDLNGVAGRDGSKVTTVASAEYALSKRSSLYAALFSNRFADGYELDPVNIAALGRDPAASSTNGFSLGVRHDF